MADVREVGPVFELKDGRSRAAVAPGRGALVTAFAVGERAVLRPVDAGTLADRGKSVRGGIPVLFPIAGKLPDDRYVLDGREYRMKQHGFARDRAWSASVENGAVVCRLVSDAETRASFPFDFAASLTVSLSGTRLTLTFAVENRGARAMPLHLGFHPYFAVPVREKANVRIETDALRGVDTRTGALVDAGEPDFSKPIDLQLLDHHPLGTTITAPGLDPVRLGWDDPFRVLTLWTQADGDFVCVEPWTARGGALASGEALHAVSPTTPFRASFWIELSP